MVEGLTSSATDLGSVAGIVIGPDQLRESKIDITNGARASPPGPCRSRPNNIQTQRILVTLAERPYPFPSRTRKSSSPAPKILRGQPFGKIGRRQDFCVSEAAPADAGTIPRTPCSGSLGYPLRMTVAGQDSVEPQGAP